MDILIFNCKCVEYAPSVIQYCVIMNRLQNVEKSLKGNQNFRYTVDNGILTLEQRQFYEDNGYIVVKGFLKDKDIDVWTKRFVQFCDKSIPP